MQSPLVHVSRSEFDEIGEQHYGLGLTCYTYRGERAVAHDGGWIGWGTRMDMLPDRRLGVVVLTNRAPSPVTNILSHAVFDRICGKEPVPWFDRFRQRRLDFLAQQNDDRKARGCPQAGYQAQPRVGGVCGRVRTSRVWSDRHRYQG
jgi:CubicO group peptidase (beta-lactamase class C family)